MNIGLIDIDGHNFPNLALMKISAYHKLKGDNVEFAIFLNEYDILYKSKVFTFTPDDITNYDAKKIICGGTGYKNYNIVLKDEIEYICPDYDLYNFKHALGFLTRGCNNNCSFCIVPKKEGNVRKNQDIEEFLNGMNTAILLDNNVLSCEWGLSQIEKIINLKIKVDFNQGLSGKIISHNNQIAELLSKVKWLKPLRMACDTLSNLDNVIKAIELLRRYKTTPKNYFIYTIVKKDIKDSLKIARELKKLKVDVFAQPYIDYNGNKNITDEQKYFCRWVNHKAIFKSIDFLEYKK